MPKTQIIQLFHIIAIGSFFIYIGITKTNLPDFMFPLLIFHGAFVFAYHLYKTFTNPERAWIYLIHVLLISPLLIYIGINGKNTERKFFEYLLLLAFATIGYNGFYFLQSM